MNEREPHPKHDSADDKVGRLRERAMDLLADASVHVQRLDDAARRIGVTEDLVEGIGDSLYDVAVLQLEIASRVLERSQRLVDRLLDATIARERDNQFRRVDAKIDREARLDLVVRNAGEHTAEVCVEARWTSDPSLPKLTWIVGQPQLPPKRETAIEITIPPLATAGVRPFSVHVELRHGHRQPIHALSCECELWVRA